MKNPLLTIITVVYNEANTIEKTISSIVNQCSIFCEYIIIDGGSTDGTVDIIKKYENYITNWRSEKDNGIYSAMNKGIEIAKGDFILFIEFYHFFQCWTI